MNAPRSAVFTHHQISEVLNGLEEPAVLLGTDLKILAANREYRARFEADEPVTGRHCYAVSHHYERPCDEMGETCCVHECLASGDPCRTLHVHFTRNGREHHEVTTYPVTDDGGQVTAFLEVVDHSGLGDLHESREQLVGHSPVFNRMLEMVRRVAPTNTTTLLLGESGTGKELVARAIHRLSPRSGRAFVPVECSGLSESLFESELFGHEKGSFTGASRGKMGLVEAAEGGTLFLDEVGDIPPAQQVKLLRLIETGTYRRVGNVTERKAHFRLICATHTDLTDLVRQGRFRGDLYYRISAFPVRLPPLRERLEDVPALVDSLLDRLGYQGKLRIHPDTLATFQRYPYPGNVRELLNILERACLMVDGGTILPRHLPPELVGGQPGTGLSGTVGITGGPTVAGAYPCGEIVPLSELESCYLRQVLQTFAGTNRQLADRLGVSERTLYRKLATVREEE